MHRVSVAPSFVQKSKQKQFFDGMFPFPLMFEIKFILKTKTCGGFIYTTLGHCISEIFQLELDIMRERKIAGCSSRYEIVKNLHVKYSSAIFGRANGLEAF